MHSSERVTQHAAPCVPIHPRPHRCRASASCVSATVLLPCCAALPCSPGQHLSHNGSTHRVVRGHVLQELHIVLRMEGRHVLGGGPRRRVVLHGITAVHVAVLGPRGCSWRAAGSAHKGRRGLDTIQGLRAHCIHLSELGPAPGRRHPAGSAQPAAPSQQHAPLPACCTARSAAPGCAPCARGAASWGAPGLQRARGRRAVWTAADVRCADPLQRSAARPKRPAHSSLRAGRQAGRQQEHTRSHPP
jgi:hypothetical protein